MMADLDNDLSVPLDELRQFSSQMTLVQKSAQSFSSSLTSGLKSALTQGQSLETIFKQIALSVSSQALTSALSPVESALTTGTSSVLGSLFSSITPFAKGGVVSSPTYFGSGSNLGLTGEAGAEAILPLSRDGSGRLGVRTGQAGGGSGRVNINVQTADVKSFARSQVQVSAMIARAVKRGQRGL